MDPVLSTRLEPAAPSPPGELAPVQAVLARAIELAGAPEPVPGRADLAIAAEVAAELDIPLDALAVALAEHQAVPSGRRSLTDRLIGTGAVVSTRAAGAGDHLGALARRLDAAGLRVHQGPDGHLVAVPRGGVVGAAGRTVRSVRGTGTLGRLARIEATQVRLDERVGAVCVVADVTNRRRRAVTRGAAVGLGVTAAVGLTATVVPVAVVGAPVAVVAGAVTARRSHRRNLGTVGDEVEAVVADAVSGSSPPSMVGRLGRRLRPRSA